MADNFTPTQTGQVNPGTDSLANMGEATKNVNTWESALGLTSKLNQAVSQVANISDKEQAEKDKIQIERDRVQASITKAKNVEETNIGTFLGIQDSAKAGTMDIEDAEKMMTQTRLEILEGRSDMSISKQKGYLTSTNNKYSELMKQSTQIKSNRQISNYTSESITNMKNIEDMSNEISEISTNLSVPKEKVRDAITTGYLDYTVSMFSNINTKEGYDIALKEHKTNMVKLNSKLIYGTTATKGYYADLVKASKKGMDNAIKDAKTRYENNAKDYLAGMSKDYIKPFDGVAENALSNTGKNAEQQNTFRKNYVKQNEEVTSMNSFNKRDVVGEMSYGDKEIMEKYPQKTKIANEKMIKDKYKELSQNGAKDSAANIVSMVSNNPGQEKYLGTGIKERINGATDSNVIKNEINMFTEIVNSPNGSAVMEEILPIKDMSKFFLMDYFSDNKFGGDFIEGRNYVNSLYENKIEGKVVKELDKHKVSEEDEMATKLGFRGNKFKKVMSAIYDIGGQDAYDVNLDKVYNQIEAGISIIEKDQVIEEGTFWDTEVERLVTIDKSIANRVYPNKKEYTDDDYDEMNNELMKTFKEDTGAMAGNIVDLGDTIAIYDVDGGNHKVYSVSQFVNKPTKLLTEDDIKNKSEKFGMVKEIFTIFNTGASSFVGSIFGVEYIPEEEERIERTDRIKKASTEKTQKLLKQMQSIVDELPTTIPEKTLDKLTSVEKFKVLGSLDKNKYKQEQTKNFIRLTNIELNKKVKFNKKKEEVIEDKTDNSFIIYKK